MKKTHYTQTLFFDYSTNYIGDSNQTLKEFTPTPEGQKAYLEWLIFAIKKNK